MMILALTFALLEINITDFTYPIFGHSLYFNLLLLFLSIKMRFCLWHQILIGNMIFAITLEWIDVNFSIFEEIITFVQIILSVSTISAILSLFYLNKHGIFEKTSP